MKKIFVLLFLATISFVLYAEDASAAEVLYFFYSDSCPHCHEAMPFVEELEKERPDITVKKLEVSKDEVNRAVFIKKLRSSASRAAAFRHSFLRISISWVLKKVFPKKRFAQ